MSGLLHPAFLWLAALAVPLIALYLLKARRERRTVSAVWLWEEARRDLEARVRLSKLRRDWLLWLQLLVLALLVLAAAGPYRQLVLGAGGDTAVVVDASASMLAGARPAELEATLRRLVDGLGPGDRMALVRAATRAEVLAPLGHDRRALMSALERARPAPVAAELTPAVELAASLVGEKGTVVVVTDASGVAPAVRADERLRVLRLGDAAGEALDNVGIVSLGVRATDSSASDHEVFVRLANASLGAARGTLLLRVDGDVRDAVELEVGPAAEVGRTLRLPGVAAAGAGVENTLVEVVWRGEGDALAVDDRAYWVLRPEAGRRFRVEGPADPYLLRALAAIAESGSGWRRAAAGETADVEVLVATSPADAGAPFLAVDPPEGRLEEIAGSAVLSWEKTHPALRFVDLRSVRLGRIHRRQRPAGARVLAESGAGPLILEGAHRGRRYLMWAFDPMETDLPVRVAYPLLVRHALEYLAPTGGDLAGGRATGAPPPMPWDGGAEAGAVTLTSPSGRVTPLAPSGGSLRLPALEEAGVWKLAGGGRELRFATSLLDSGESDLSARRAGAGSGPSGAGEAAGGARDARPRDALRGLWRPLVLAALVLLLVEALAFHRRWTL